jgi:hypothetical protein
MAFPSTSTEFAMIDTRTTSGAFVLPFTTEIPGRIINIKDAYGAFTNSSLTVYTQGGEVFEDGTNFRILNNAWDQLQVYTASTSRWYVTGGTEQVITTTNISVVSTLQTFNWPSLCNQANIGYGSTFNPAAIGRIALLDNVFTSSTAGLVSTFIELGNLNAQPTIMSTGGAFRWLMGVEPDIVSMGRGLQFKIKRWNSFGFSNSPIFYGANLSTLLDTVNIDSRGFVGINCNAPSTFLDVNGPVRVLASTIVQSGATAISIQTTGTAATNSIQAYSGGNAAQLNLNPMVVPNGAGTVTVGGSYTGSSYALSINGLAEIQGGALYVTSGPTTNTCNCLIQWSGTAAVFASYQRDATLRRDVQIAALNNSGTTNIAYFDGTNIRLGVNTTAPSVTLDANGITRCKIPISNITATSLSPTSADYSTHYSLSNTGFNTMTLPALSGNSSNNGWFVVLRNATTVAMSITFTTNACNNIPSPLSLASSNSITIGYDFTNTVFRAF